jgi:ADP-heptose:LPS heptosyltransferase
VALRAAGIGDLLTGVPALRALEAGTGLPVKVATPAWLHDLVPLVPGVTAVVDTRGLQPVLDDRPALAVNLHGSGPQSHRALRALRPTRLWGYRCDGFPDGPEWDPEEPERVRWCRLLAWHGVPCDPEDVCLRVPARDPAVDGAVVLHLGGSHADRRWPVRQWVRLAQALQGEGCAVVLSGGTQDAAAGALVAERAGVPDSAVLTGRLGLLDVAALVARARLVVSGDTGVAHLATAYAAPSVTIFGPESVRRWGPPAAPRHRVLRAPGARPVAADVPLDEVLDAVAGLLRGQVVA